MSAFRERGKVFATNSVYTTALKAADDFFLSPLIYEEHYISSLISYCKENFVEAIISLFDIDLLVLAKNQKKIEENGITLMLAPEKSVEICNDKWETYQFLKQIKVRTPKTYIEIDKAIDEVKQGRIRFPLIIKPRWGAGSLHIYKVDNTDELNVLYKKCKKDLFNSYLKYESSLTKDTPVIIQEYLNGNEYGLDIINDLEANYLETFVKWKVAMRAGETDVGKTVNNKEFVKDSKKISSNIKQKGILSVDCIKHNNEIYVIEMNCRISGHYPLSHLAGFNYPKLIVNMLSGNKNVAEFLKFREGLTITKDIVPVII